MNFLKDYESKINNFEKLSIVSVVFVACYFILFYLDYSFSAWFFQDDFVFLEEYRHSLGWIQLSHIEWNLGRFISRNLYWNFLYNIFGFNAMMYYVINLLTMIASTYILFKIINSFIENKIYSALFATFYLTNFATLTTFLWISNSQHIIAHFFIFLTLYIAIKIYKKDICDKKDYFILFLVFLMGLYSNALIVFILPVIFIIFLFTSKNRNTLDYRLLIILTAISIYFVFTLNSAKSAAYETDYSFIQIYENLQYYLSVLKIKPWLFYSLSLILISKSIFNKNYNALIFVLLSVSFFIPFAFLMYQKYPNYIVLSYIFYFIFMIVSFKNKHFYPILVVLLVYLSLVNTDQINKFRDDPYGKNLKVFVNNIKNYDSKKIVLKSDVVKENNTDFKEWSMPGFWWFLGFGRVFDLMQIKKDISLYDSSQKYDSQTIIITIDDNFKIKEVKKLEN